MSYARDLDLALRLADAADALSMERFGARDLVIDQKPDASHVTDADRAVEQRIRAMLEQEVPDDGIFGEEFGSKGDSRRQWIIDPIDGTANYLRGVPVWATLIALVVDHHPVVGVCSSPALGRRWWASAGEGAWTNPAAPQRLHVSGIDALADASISYNSLQGWDAEGRLDDLVSLSRSVWRTRAYSDAWSYMLLAEGVLDAVAEFDLKPYDMAALVPIIEEAGGTFTSIGGDRGPWHGSALATNGSLHSTLLERLAQ